MSTPRNMLNPKYHIGQTSSMIGSPFDLKPTISETFARWQKKYASSASLYDQIIFDPFLASVDRDRGPEWGPGRRTVPIRDPNDLIAFRQFHKHKVKFQRWAKMKLLVSAPSLQSSTWRKCHMDDTHSWIKSKNTMSSRILPIVFLKTVIFDEIHPFSSSWFELADSKAVKIRYFW